MLCAHQFKQIYVHEGAVNALGILFLVFGIYKIVYKLSVKLRNDLDSVRLADGHLLYLAVKRPVPFENRLRFKFEGQFLIGIAFGHVIVEHI